MLLAQVIVGGLLLGAIYALFSSGLTLIWGMMNFINFAHGEFVMLGMYVALLVVVWLGGGAAAFGAAAAFWPFCIRVLIYRSRLPPVARVGAGGGQRRHRRSADGDVVSVVALRRRDIRVDCFRRGHAGRLRQRAGRNVCRAHHRIDPSIVGLLVRPDLQRHRRLCAVRCAVVVAAAGIDGEGVRRMAL